MVRLTPEKEAYIKEHYSDTKNDELARAIGYSISTVGRYAQEKGLRKSKEFLRECQANATRHAVIMNKGKKRPEGWSIPFSEKYRFKKGQTQWSGCRDEEKAEIIERIKKKRAETLKSERRRMLYGLPPKTNIRLSFLSKVEQRKRTNIRNKLRNRGYKVMRGSCTAYYTKDTRRSRNEEEYKKVGFRFIGE